MNDRPLSLVTGATGFVGSRVAQTLLDAGHAVRALVRLHSDRTNLNSLNAETIVGDLRDPASLDKAVEGCDNVFHVAADYRLWSRRPAELYASNVDGTRNLMEAALRHGVARIVYTSSVATLGLLTDGRSADESTAVSLDDMIGHYKRSKFLAEEVVRKLTAERGLPAIIVNPSTPVGPGDVKPTPTGRLIRDLVNGAMPAYVDTGLNVVHVDDVARGHLLAFEKGQVGRRYILGGENLYLRDIIAIVAKISGRPGPKLRLPHAFVYPVAWVSEAWARLTAGGEPRATVAGVKMSKKLMFFSSERAESELGYVHRPAPDALADAVDWFADRDLR